MVDLIKYLGCWALGTSLIASVLGAIVALWITVTHVAVFFVAGN